MATKCMTIFALLHVVYITFLEWNYKLTLKPLKSINGSENCKSFLQCKNLYQFYIYSSRLCVSENNIWQDLISILKRHFEDILIRFSWRNLYVNRRLPKVYYHKSTYIKIKCRQIQIIFHLNVRHTPSYGGKNWPRPLLRPLLTK